ncbi:thioredoxin-like protein [Myxozyma melibiosi]|uniref:thioredoxin-dependent peroxiredoxin n=1 Tax=Myxozyma melibiosi TaxID=54550 RepID=A0ABR1FBH0_9ASCO
MYSRAVCILRSCRIPMPPRKVKEPVDPSTLRRSGRSRASSSSSTATAAAAAEIPAKTTNAKIEKSSSKPVSSPKPATTTTATSAVLELGDALPDVAIETQDGEPVNLAQLASSKKMIVIFAYPKASTPGCTRQACGFRDEFPKFDAADVAVFGLSADSVAAQKKFKDNQKLPYDLIADTKYQLLGPLGAKKTAAGGIVRSYWVVKDGKLATKVIGVKPEDSVSKSLKEVLESN